jgi:D-alanyl-D-alanine carboxypeptidase/D-alanyl-D-alanine-endopeptidase (penicillin-binding protein 4)
MLKPSDNDIAELLARRVAIATGRAPTWAGWQAAAASLLRDAGIGPTGIRIVDGSGLSRANRITATAMASLLGRITLSTDPRYAGFAGALPIAGRDGTLAASNGRFSSAPASCAAGRVIAKTGTLTGAVALSGYATAKDGRIRVFSFIVNSPPASSSRLDVRRALDRLAATVVGCF